jgi:hypothetical protein
LILPGTPAGVRSLDYQELRMKKLFAAVLATLFALSATAALAADQAKKDDKKDTTKKETTKKEKKGGC